MTKKCQYEDKLQKLILADPCLGVVEPKFMKVSKALQVRGVKKLLIAHHSRSNIENVNYADGGQSLDGPLWAQRVNESSIDNFCLEAVQPSYNFVSTGVGSFRKCNNVSALNHFIRGAVEDTLKFKVGKGLKAHMRKGPPSLEQIAIYKQKYPEQRKEWDKSSVKWVGQGFKLAMPDVPVDDALLNRFEQLGRKLQENAIFIADIDFKRDFKACLRTRSDLECYLHDDCGDRVQLQRDIKSAQVEWDREKLLLLDNTRVVGNNCHTFMRCDTNGGTEETIRFKAYNKFAQTVESPAVCKDGGCHVADWCNQAGMQLKKGIDACIECGLTRIECTWYDRIPKSMVEVHNLS
ncbi:hypothetical protein CYMTET_30978 [Cymbomonas tetramitiformis]|uniref:Uncharacterized protein n=1 Tax=Cymbomonas tetramitiformis TaxID=36881 RepID=A0AAE0FI13_9CHLO|nr:hypothetical protein CYMTET_30978 [Cymbomonas tetramitiformis]